MKVAGSSSRSLVQPSSITDWCELYSARTLADQMRQTDLQVPLRLILTTLFYTTEAPWRCACRLFENVSDVSLERGHSRQLRTEPCGHASPL
jgi:hypothetical protein